MKKLLSIALALCMALSLCVTTTWAAENTVTVNGEGYETFADALAVAKLVDGDVTIDLLGKTHVLKDLTYDRAALVNISKNTTFKNGTFNISYVDLSGSAGFEGIFCVYDGVNATFENIIFTGEAFYSAAGVIKVSTAAGVTGKSTVTLKNCTFDLENEKCSSAAVLQGSGVGNGEFVITDCQFTLENVQRVFLQMTIDMTDTTITSAAGTSKNHAFRNVAGEIKNSTVTADGHETGIKNDGAMELKVKDSSVTLKNSKDGDLVLKNGADVAVEGTSALTYTTPSEGYKEVKLDLNGGTGVDTIIVTSDTFNTNAYTPTREGYTFVGWEDDEGTVWPADTTFTFAQGVEKVTLTAQWEEIPAAEPTHHHTRRQPTTTTTDTTVTDTTKTDTVTSAKTFDAGIAVYAAMGILSLTGSAWVVGKKKEF